MNLTVNSGQSSHTNAPSHLYHYTNVESLACILKNKTLRFTPLTHLDDPQESHIADLSTLAKHVFVSCWTNDQTESIPMWRMYASEASGVRIKLPTAPFSLHENIESLKQHGATITAPIEATVTPQSEMLEQGYFLTSMLFTNPVDMLRRVIYVSDAAQLVPNVLIDEGNEKSIILDKIGTYKNK